MQHFPKRPENAFLGIQFLFPFWRGNCYVKYFLLPSSQNKGEKTSSQSKLSSGITPKSIRDITF